MLSFDTNPFVRDIDRQAEYCADDKMLVSVTVTNGSVRLKPWCIVPVTEGTTVLDLYNDVVSKTADADDSWSGLPDNLIDASTTCFIGKNKTDGDRLFMNALVTEAAETFGRYVRYDLIEKVPNTTIDSDSTLNSVPAPSPSVNAFQILLHSQKEKVLPKKLQISHENRKHELYNKFVELLGDCGLGFSKTSVDKEGTRFVKDVTDAIWYMDPYVKSMTQRNNHFPKIFSQFLGFNNPSSHRHHTKPVDRDHLLIHADNMELLLQQPWMSGKMWGSMYQAVLELSTNLTKYARYLEIQLKESTQNQSMDEPVRDLAESQNLTVIYPKYAIKPTFAARYKSLIDHLGPAKHFDPICLDEFTPPIARERRYYLQNISQCMPFKCVYFRVSYGNNLGTHNFLWRIPTEMKEAELLAKNNEVCTKLVDMLPVYHTKEMHRKFIRTCSLITPKIKPVYLRHIYRSLTGDSSTGANEMEKDIDARVKEAFEMEDPDIICDLREHNSGRPEKYSLFFEKTKQFLENVVEMAVDDRRHNMISHLAAAISVPDLLRQVSATCGPDIPIPSEQWLYLQFAPKNPTALTSLQFTGKLDVKFSVQCRQFREEHEDMHYASALFRYQKELAVKFRNFVTFVCEDDKHYAKVGEPGNPVAAVERGRRVLTAEGVKYVVSDHDFTKFSLIPSVIMILDLPESMTGSFYRGQVYVGIKDHVFETSSPLRHATELYHVLREQNSIKPILCLYTDGGPDHRCTYLSVKLALLCLFLIMDLDLLVAVRTPPKNSWKNPPERIMSIINLGLQCIGLQRAKMTTENETAIKSAGSLKQLRHVAGGNPDLKEAMLESLQPVKELMNQILTRLKLKETFIKTFGSSTKAQMDDLWSTLELEVHDMKQATLQKALERSGRLKNLFDHCATSRHYMFCLKKCGVDGCDYCGKPKLPTDIFEQLHILPDPTPGEDGHYLSFGESFGMVTNETCRPSLSKKIATGHHIPFSPSAQTARTAKTVVECSECDRPRVLYAAKKLNPVEEGNLQKLLDSFSYSCGATLSELKTPNNKTPIINALVDKVFVRSNLTCSTPIEIPYFSSKCFVDVCSHCGTSENIMESQADGSYPSCQNCKILHKGNPIKRKRNLHAERKGPTKQRIM